MEERGGLKSIGSQRVGHDGACDGWMDGWMDGWIDGWMNGWMNGWMKEVSMLIIENVREENQG